MLTLLLSLAIASPLDEQPGRTQSRVYSAPYAFAEGRSVEDMRLLERLERLGYRRVRSRPTQEGEFFYGDDIVWIYRRGFRRDGVAVPAELLGMRIERGRAVGSIDERGNERRFGADDALEPELLATSFDEARARMRPIDLSALPNHVWQPVLALEDHRFFEHVGVDGIAIARALFENVRGGEVSQGGSTITQQLVKNRDLSPKRTLDRKASEAVRALALEAEYSKEDILEAYLNTVYYGHVDGVAIYGLGAASQVYFSKPAHELSVDEAATLAAVLQGPNGLHPLRHPEACRERRDRALTRLEDLGWATPTEVRLAKARALGTKASTPAREAGRGLLAALETQAREDAAQRLDKDLGVVIETSLDPLAQEAAEAALARRLRDYKDVQGAVVLVDAGNGAVRAYVGGDPAHPDAFDRAGTALRQPGSTAKPFAMLEAVERCGDRGPLHLQSWLSDSPLSIDTPAGPWTPDNYDHKDHGATRLRDALVHSYNRPFARVGRLCGADAVGERMASAGLTMPEEVPQSVVLGTVETTPLALAGAYTAFVDGKAHRPVLVTRIEKPGGGVLFRDGGESLAVATPTGARLVRSALADVVERGTATRAKTPGVSVVGKTGSTAADAWFAGQAEGLVAVVWLGKDDASKLGISGGKGAAPVAKELAPLALAWPAPQLPEPLFLVTREIDPDTGLRVGALGSGEPELFRRGVVPPTKPLLGKGRPEVLD
ncbi:MAG: hypothetical protein EP330_19880 [Deltaproteobacteria bacterium]|nr:MAG: hypothetical protein EP330_19880 [Deltaproteobacteria bacterium]